MAFNFNGNVPNKIIYNGNNVEKLVYNGVTVWTASNPYYAIQNGKAVNLPNGSVSLYGDYWGQSEGSEVLCGQTGTYIYGAIFRVRNSNTDTGCTVNTGNMSTEGCKKVTIVSHDYIWGVEYNHGGTFTLYGDGNVISTWNVVNDRETNVGFSDTRTVDISAYSNVRVVAKHNDWVQEGETIAPAISCGFRSIQFHN